MISKILEAGSFFRFCSGKLSQRLARGHSRRSWKCRRFGSRRRSKFEKNFLGPRKFSQSMFPWPHEKKLFVTRKVFLAALAPAPLRKHLGLTSPPCLIEQHLLVHSFGPVPSTEAACRCFVRNCADVFLQKERR